MLFLQTILQSDWKYFFYKTRVQIFFTGVQSSISHFVEIFTSLALMITRQSDLLQPIRAKLRTQLLGLKFLEANSPLNFGNFPRPIVSGSVPRNSRYKLNNSKSKYLLPIVVQIFQFAGSFIGLSFSLGLNSLVQIIFKQWNLLLGVRVAL